MKIPRNAPCPCGSAKKYKHCHGRLGPAAQSWPAADFARTQARHVADELIRQQQQGLGRPIISTDWNSHKVVAVRDRLMWSDKWKTFPDFLADYMKNVLGADWGNAEIAKPFEERHPIMQWHDGYCHYQQTLAPGNPGEVFTGEMNGVAACYLGLAYSLYLIEHNAELQGRLVARLKNLANFQGAYYELMVASIIIRAGFELVLEDEADRHSKHCEFAAVSKRTDKRYWVEAKMRAVAGVLGKTDADRCANRERREHGDARPGHRHAGALRPDRGDRPGDAAGDELALTEPGDQAADDHDGEAH
jgi:SEC-C motif